MTLRDRIAAAVKRRTPRPVRRLLRRARTRLSPITVLGGIGAKRARAVPQLREFIEAVVPAAQGADRTQLETCRRSFQKLVRGDALQALVDFELTHVDPRRTNQQFDVDRRLPILGGPDFSLDVAFLGGDAPVAEIERNALIGLVGNVPVWVDKFNISGNETWDVVDPSIRAEPCFSHPLEPRTVMLLERGEICRIRADGCGAAILQFRFGASAAVRRHYDAESLSASFVKPVDIGWHRLHEALGVIEALNDRNLLERVLPLTAHPSHFIRWAALRTIHRIAPDQARPLLEEAANDAHPQVRAAAGVLLAGGILAPSEDPEISIAWH